MSIMFGNNVQITWWSTRDGWQPGQPPENSLRTASHAADILERAQLYSTTQEALQDLNCVYAATARSRAMNKPVIYSRDLYQDCDRLLSAVDAEVSDHSSSEASNTVSQGGEAATVSFGLMFGRENSGLSNTDVAQANKVVTIDANPEYPIMNLAQASTVILYDLYQSHQRQKDLQALAAGSMHSIQSSLITASNGLNSQELASKAEVESFLSMLYRSLDYASFYESDAAKTENVEMHIRNLLNRVEALSSQDLRLLHGMLSKLSKQQKQKA